MSSNGWKSYSLGSLCIGIFDGPHATPKKTENGPIFLGISNLNKGRIDLSNAEHLSEEDFHFWTKRILPKPNDLVFSYETRLGEASLIPDGLRCCLGRRMGLLRFDTTRVDPKFMLYAYLGPEFQQTIRSRTIYGSTVDRIPLIELPDFPITIPSLSKQRQIAGILSALDDKIELNRQMNAMLEAMAQAIFKEWFVDFNFPGATGEMVESELGMIPKGWRVVRLGEISDLSWGDTTTTKDSYTTEGYLAYSASGPDGFLPYSDFLRDGIVVSAIGAYSGKTWFAQGNWSCIKNTIRFWSTNDDISNEYLFLYTSSKAFWPLRGSAQPFISQTDAREKKIIYPGDHLAMYFGKIIHPLLELIRRNDDEASTLSQIRDLLLPKLMNGKIEI